MALLAGRHSLKRAAEAVRSSVAVGVDNLFAAHGLGSHGSNRTMAASADPVAGKRFACFSPSVTRASSMLLKTDYMYI